jgi:DNA-directed RNA polymerase subunit H (RpoH/RPB5)
MDLDLEFEYSIEEKNKKILKTCVNILIYRNLLDKNKYKDYVKEIINNINDDETYIKLNNNKYFRIKFLYEIKVSKITDYYKTFIFENIDDIKFIILEKKSFTQRLYNEVYNDINKNKKENNIELFRDYELIFNVFKLVYSPKYMILNNEEYKSFINDYKINEDNKYRELSKIYNTDIISRYLNVKTGDIIKIVTPNELSGYSINYRIVVPGKLFE